MATENPHIELDSTYDDYDFPTTAPRPQPGKPILISNPPGRQCFLVLLSQLTRQLSYSQLPNGKLANSIPGHPGYTTPEQDSTLFVLRTKLLQAGYTERLDTLTLVCSPFTSFQLCAMLILPNSCDSSEPASSM